ncbi:MAG TPA: bifunctional 3-(3-hydroxy-phenyl)propionate/3-hydroxycinnamic acid hydroxylase [Pseudonocardiaceae bacterium]|jgi:3-(3-hydroxy-phenyl)propionate hydroxylase|nr:bifunctional 3-(3-hydroxy-phenyl)propionate/3-hydroxycinnamic acid hydroxylase [Pseudonocardiaceae bacterium]
MTTRIPVVIIGAGPTGLTAAAFLAQYGVECVVLDRWESIYPQPRAVHLDDEVYRLLARIGLADEFAKISRPCRGLRLVDRNLRVLAEFDRSAERGRHGHPEANMFDQPDLEAILRANLAGCPSITLRGNTEVTELKQRADHVRVTCTDLATGRQEIIEAGHVLGCDGANSVTRTSIGATMRDLGFTQRWLVVDIATDADIDQWEGVHQVCDPARPATYMRIGATRYRWEFRLSAGETIDDYGDLARVRPLIAPWTAVDDLTLVRVAEYTFRARIASRWRDRRVFLLGDAAHLTPPFIGQGMGAGVRDAANLAWKLAAVRAGTLPERALDTYEIEREPHVRALIRLAKLIGTAMTEGGRVGNALRGALAPLLPRFSALVLDSRTPALHRSDLVVRPRRPRALGGTLCPNVILDDGRRFDEVVGGGFAVVTSDSPSPRQSAELERWGGVLVPARPGSALHRWLQRGSAKSATVRPDGTVMSAQSERLTRETNVRGRTQPDHAPNGSDSN